MKIHRDRLLGGQIDLGLTKDDLSQRGTGPRMPRTSIQPKVALAAAVPLRRLAQSLCGNRKSSGKIPGLTQHEDPAQRSGAKHQRQLRVREQGRLVSRQSKEGGLGAAWGSGQWQSLFCSQEASSC